MLFCTDGARRKHIYNHTQQNDKTKKIYVLCSAQKRPLTLHTRHFPGVKRQGRGTDHTSASNSETINTRIYTSNQSCESCVLWKLSTTLEFCRNLTTCSVVCWQAWGTWRYRAGRLALLIFVAERLRSSRLRLGPDYIHSCYNTDFSNPQSHLAAGCTEKSRKCGITVSYTNKNYCLEESELFYDY
jgi:hypothetical protein